MNNRNNAIPKEFLYRARVQPPFFTGHGALFRLGFGFLSVSSFPSNPFDSEDPFCLSETVSTTKSAICKNSLSQFSKVAWRKCPDARYDIRTRGARPSSCLSLLCSAQPVRACPTSAAINNPRKTIEREFFFQKSFRVALVQMRYQL